MSKVEGLKMSDQRPVSIELHHEIEQFYYREARMLDNEMLREWLDTIVDPNIHYRLVKLGERFSKDKSPEEVKDITPYDEDHNTLDLRVRHFETGLQTMLDPGQQMFREITNVEAFHNDKEDEFTVLSYGSLSRFRRIYERERYVYGRKDILRREGAGNYRLLSRNVELGGRVVRKNLLLFF